VFLSFQYPLEIPGVPALTFIRTALNAQRKARGEAEIAAPAFLKKARETAAALKIDFEMLKRALNVGFSGGEKKRMEIFQMAMLEPRFADPRRDRQRPGHRRPAQVVSEGVNALRSPERGMLVITHYQRLLDYIKPDRVHVLSRRQASSPPAGRSWRCSLRPRATTSTCRRWRHDVRSLLTERGRRWRTWRGADLTGSVSSRGLASPPCPSAEDQAPSVVAASEQAPPRGEQGRSLA
jgi:hypothetical protein